MATPLLLKVTVPAGVPAGGLNGRGEDGVGVDVDGVDRAGEVTVVA